MTTRDGYAHGEFCWVDLSSTDMKAAAKWYGEVLGWGFAPGDTQGGPPYGMLTKGDAVVAGLGELSEAMRSEGVPPTWNSYVAVDDAAAVEAKVEALGGSVVVPTMQVLDAGKLAFFADPEGAVFAVWEKGAHFGADVVNEPGSFCWNELATRDLDRAAAFYSGLFGWEIVAMEGPAPTKMAIVRNAGRDNGDMLQMTEEWGDLPSHWMVYLAVEDCDAAAKRVSELGGKVGVPPTDIPPGRFSVCTDPQGAVFTVIALKSPPRD